jgi:hypothetical protein
VRFFALLVTRLHQLRKSSAGGFRVCLIDEFASTLTELSFLRNPSSLPFSNSAATTGPKSDHAQLLQVETVFIVTILLIASADVYLLVLGYLRVKRTRTGFGDNSVEISIDQFQDT